MSATATASSTSPAAGWYPDPRGADGRLRWWDGAAWTTFTTEPPSAEPEPEAPHLFADVVADASAGEDVPVDDDGLDDFEPIEFSWSDPADLFEVNVSEPAEPEDGPFVFRARSLGAEVPSLPVYESPLATIASPISTRVEIPVRIEAPAPAPMAPVEAEAEVEPPAAPPRRRLALAGTGAVVAVAATAAIITNMLTGDAGSGPRRAAAAGSALSASERGCLKEWNTTLGGGMGELRVTLGQFEGALAQVAQVTPLPGTVMAPDSCALTVYDPASETSAVFVSGVEDQVGYLDVTSYPRAVKQYGAPRNAGQANVAIRADGSLRAL